jgi:DNA-binding NarL/FixJ family response regulator
VLALLVEGLSNRQIGERLYLSVKTVEKHVEHLMDKLELTRRLELAAVGRSAGVGANYGQLRG